LIDASEHLELELEAEEIEDDLELVGAIMTILDFREE